MGWGPVCLQPTSPFLWFQKLICYLLPAPVHALHMGFFNFSKCQLVASTPLIYPLPVLSCGIVFPFLPVSDGAYGVLLGDMPKKSYGKGFTACFFYPAFILLLSCSHHTFIMLLKYSFLAFMLLFSIDIDIMVMYNINIDITYHILDID
ncbi:MAG: hypothetical protein MSA77_01095 [Selenomonadales bacterium]|nr:hypothetical protein [Selenomonadales bacterium]